MSDESERKVPGKGFLVLFIFHSQIRRGIEVADFGFLIFLTLLVWLERKSGEEGRNARTREGCAVIVNVTMDCCCCYCGVTWGRRIWHRGKLGLD